MTNEELLAAVAEMERIRTFEDRVSVEFAKGDMPGFVHSYSGAEAIAVGVMGALMPDDLITSTHRGHGHCLAKLVPVEGVVAELFGRESGLCRGRGGSMHIADFGRGMLGANAIVGGGIAIAVGGALASSVLGDGRVAVAFFGDGASNEGVFHESLNLAAIWRLPVIFVCENNGWAESTPFTYSSSVASVADRAASYGIPGIAVDGTDVEEVHSVATHAVLRARIGDGPTLIECRIPRREGHFVGDPEGYRGKESIDAARNLDPIEIARSRLHARGLNAEELLAETAAQWRARLDDAYATAREAALPGSEEVEQDVYAR